MGVDLATNSHGLRDYEYRYERTPDTLLVANFPELHDVQHYRLQEITDLMKQAADEDGVAFIDLRDSVKNQDSSKVWVTRPDPHPNSLANKFYADALCQKLRTLQ
jgi:hypothetical protein